MTRESIVRLDRQSCSRLLYRSSGRRRLYATIADDRGIRAARASFKILIVPNIPAHVPVERDDAWRTADALTSHDLPKGSRGRRNPPTRASPRPRRLVSEPRPPVPIGGTSREHDIFADPRCLDLLSIFPQSDSDLILIFFRY